MIFINSNMFLNEFMFSDNMYHRSYYYGHYYAGLLMDHVPQKDRARLQDHMATTIMKLQEKEGDWWDYPLYDYHRQYGTAMAVMILQKCLRKPRVKE